MILAIDPGLATCGWAIVAPKTGRVRGLGVLTSSPSSGIDESTDRARRAWDQAHALGSLYRANGCTALAAEAMSFGGPPKARFAMAIALGLSWGALAALARELGAPLYEVTPKEWQHAVDPEIGEKIDYDRLYRRLARFVSSMVASQLTAIVPNLRNHAIDAVGVGLYTAFTPRLTTIAKGAA